MDDAQATQLYKETLSRGVTLRNLSPRHREAMRLVASGMLIPEVAKRLGYSTTRLYQISNSPLWRKEMSKLQNRLDSEAYDAMRGLRQIQPVAVQALSDLMTQQLYPTARLMAIREVLDRTGVNAATETITATQSYEQKLANVQVSYSRSTPLTQSPIEVIGGKELLEEPEDDD